MKQLVLQLPFAGMADYDAVVELEHRLIASDLDVDGHDVGQGVMNVFLLCEDVQATFAHVRELLPDGLTYAAGPATWTRTTTRRCGPRAATGSRSGPSRRIRSGSPMGSPS